MKMTDDELLDRLGGALATEMAEPSYAELMALRAAVVAADNPTTRRGGRVTGWLRRPVPLVLAAAAAVAVVVGVALPRPARVVLHTANLPVDSPALVDTRDAIGDLEDALERGDRASLAGLVAEVRAHLADLGDDDRARVEPRAQRAIDRAAAATATTMPTVPPAVATSVPTSQPPATTPSGGIDGTTDTSIDDDGGDGGDNSGPGGGNGGDNSGPGSGSDAERDDSSGSGSGSD
jgi:hypothetical protein